MRNLYLCAGLLAPTLAAAGPKSDRSTEEPIILGKVDRQLIDDVIGKDMLEIRACYEKRLRVDPTITGKLVVKFVIDKKGRVSSSTVKSSTLGDPPFERCVLATFDDMRFPKPVGGGIVIVSYPFLFTAGPGPEPPPDTVAKILVEAALPAVSQCATEAQVADGTYTLAWAPTGDTSTLLASVSPLQDCAVEHLRTLELPTSASVSATVTVVDGRSTLTDIEVRP